MSTRSGLTINAAFVLGVLGALLVAAGSLLPQLSVPGHVTGSLFDPSTLLADPLAAGRNAGTAVVVFALFAIAFCMVGRYRWLIFCALMIVLFLSVALTRQLTDMLGLTIPQIIDMYNGVLPPDIDAQALLQKLPVLQATTYNQGLLVLGIGLMMMELAPWVKRLRMDIGGGRPGRRGRLEPTAVQGTEAAVPQAAVIQPPPDLLLDALYIFADGLAQPLTFSLLDPAGRVTRHRMRMEGAGYLGDAYFLRCRDIDAGNLRDIPAHMMSEIVDDLTGEPIDTDDMLDDLSRVAYEAVEGTFDETEEEIVEQPADHGAQDLVEHPASGPADAQEPMFRVETPAPDAPAREP